MSYSDRFLHHYNALVSFRDVNDDMYERGQFEKRALLDLGIGQPNVHMAEAAMLFANEQYQDWFRERELEEMRVARQLAAADVYKLHREVLGIDFIDDIFGDYQHSLGRRLPVDAMRSPEFAIWLNENIDLLKHVNAVNRRRERKRIVDQVMGPMKRLKI